MQGNMFKIISYIGLPLAGKGTTISWISEQFDNSIISIRDIGYCGMQAREFNLFISERISTFYPPTAKIENRKKIFSNIILNLKAFCGAVWTRSSIKGLVNQSDGIVYVVDSQESRSDDQEEFDRFFLETLNSVLFDWHDIPILVQLNKSDLINKKGLSKLEKKYAFYSWPTIISCGLTNRGLNEGFNSILHRVIENEMKRRGTLDVDGQIDFKLHEWDPFINKHPTSR